MKKLVCLVLPALVSVLMCVQVIHAQDQTVISLTTKKVADNVYVVYGTGGNVTVFVYEDGLLVIDTKTKSSVDLLLNEIRTLSDKPIKYVVNTHVHYDHVSGNEAFVKEGSVILSHTNVRDRMGKEQILDVFGDTLPPYPHQAMPTITFKRMITLYMDSDTISVIHLQPGHTDGDVIVYSKKSNVLCTGDLLFNYGYPYIGIESDGSASKMIESLKKITHMITAETIVIPGHGTVTDRKGIFRSIRFLSDLKCTLYRYIRQGKSLDEIQQRKPTKKYDETWVDGLPSDVFVEVLYRDLTRD